MQGDFEPARFDSSVYDCEVVGELPADLDGTFYRACAEWLYPPKFVDDSPFAADGIITSFRIANGSCDFLSRYIETPRYLANKAARRQLFGYYRNPFTHEPEIQGKYNTADTVSNTNVIWFAGKLLALKEDAPPMEMDPDTLETKGFFDFGGAYKAPTFTAHPKVDGKTGEMVTYGYEAEGLASNAIWLYTIDPDGTVTSERRITAPYLSMVHDIAISQNYIMIPVYGMVSSMERLREGKVHWGWDTKVPSHIGVLPRHGDASEIRWFDGPQLAMVHTFAATDKDGVITLDAAVSDGNPFPFFPDLDGKPFNPAAARTTVRRYTIDMNSSDSGWREDLRFQDKPGALSRIDDRLMGHDYRYGLLSYSDDFQAFTGTGRRPTNSFGKFDFVTGEVETMFAGPEFGLQEIAFAPRSADAPEGDGWVMALATNYDTMKSELVIGDTADLAAGPVARVRLPFRAPQQIHGNWVPAWSRNA